MRLRVSFCWTLKRKKALWLTHKLWNHNRIWSHLPTRVLYCGFWPQFPAKQHGWWSPLGRRQPPIEFSVVQQGSCNPLGPNFTDGSFAAYMEGYSRNHFPIFVPCLPRIFIWEDYASPNLTSYPITAWLDTSFVHWPPVWLTWDGWAILRALHTIPWGSWPSFLGLYYQTYNPVHRISAAWKQLIYKELWASRFVKYLKLKS